MLSKVLSAGLMGVEALRVMVEVDVARALPAFNVVGLPDGAVKESRDRVRAALKNSGYAFPQEKVTVNLAPADIKKEGSGFDLPMALAVLAADGILAQADLEGHLVTGELALDGSVRPVKGILPIAAKTLQMGVDRIIVPRANGREASVVEGVTVFLADTLAQVVEGLKTRTLPEYKGENDLPPDRDAPRGIDFMDVRGQGYAKRALEIAAAGGHNLLMEGPPGTGKTMLARCLPGILPPMTGDEAVETSQVYSVAGLIDPARPLLNERPFRSPHHTVSDAGLVGGGVNPRPGEVTLSHNGVLFLDELPEFKRNVLDMLRQPLEDGFVTIVRASGSISFPARFMLVGAMNPCPCGHFGDASAQCVCAPGAVERYRGKVSGPLIDRFDIRVEVPRVRYREMTGEGSEESSETVRSRVVRARKIQEARSKETHGAENARLSARAVRKFLKPDPRAAAVLERAMDKLGLSARGYTRALKVARTIADIDGSEGIGERHVLEALQLKLAGKAT